MHLLQAILCLLQLDFLQECLVILLGQCQACQLQWDIQEDHILHQLGLLSLQYILQLQDTECHLLQDILQLDLLILQGHTLLLDQLILLGHIPLQEFQLLDIHQEDTLLLDHTHQDIPLADMLLHLLTRWFLDTDQDSIMEVKLERRQENIENMPIYFLEE